MQNWPVEADFGRELGVSVERVVVAAQAVEERLRRRDPLAGLEVRLSLRNRHAGRALGALASEAPILQEEQGHLASNGQVTVFVESVDDEHRHGDALQVVEAVDPPPDCERRVRLKRLEDLSVLRVVHHPASIAADAIDQRVECREGRNRAKGRQHLRPATLVEVVELVLDTGADAERVHHGVPPAVRILDRWGFIADAVRIDGHDAWPE